jgi:phosphoribosylpyrophosphate synthetase
MVGTTEWDWYTAINAGVVHVHAHWASHLRKPVTSLMADEPSSVIELLEHFLLHEPAWAFRLDDEARSFTIRSLLPPRVRFPSDRGGTFELQDIFTRAQTITVGAHDARDVLMLRLLCSAYLDGSLPGRSFFCVYPSSTPGRVSPQLGQFLQQAKVMTGSYYEEDLLERVLPAPDTSLERWRASRGQPTADISIAAQARTVRVNPDYRKKLLGKTVIVFDDFTTEGKSLEWARTLLTSAGATQVIALTIGKYPSAHTAYQLRSGTEIDPFTINDLTAEHFLTTPGQRGVQDGPAASLKESMARFIAVGQDP